MSALAQQALEKLCQQEAAFVTHLDKFDAHPFSRYDVSHDGPGLDNPSRYLKNEDNVRANRLRDGTTDEQTSCTERFHARNLLLATTIPGHGHALWQRDASVSPCGMKRFCVHKAR